MIINVITCTGQGVQHAETARQGRVWSLSSGMGLPGIGWFFFALNPAFRTQHLDPSEREESRRHQAALPTLLALMLGRVAFLPRCTPTPRPEAVWYVVLPPKTGPGAPKCWFDSHLRTQIPEC